MSKIRLKSVKVKNYRSFGEEQEFLFPNEDYKKPIAIVGYNNCGKTNLMNAILYGIGYKYVSENTFIKTDLHQLDYDNSIEITTKLEGSDYTVQNSKNQQTQSITGEYKICAKLEEGELKSSVNPSFFGKIKHYNVFYINCHEIKNELSTKKTSWGNLTSFLAKHIKSIVESDKKMKDKKVDFKTEISASTKKVLVDSDLSSFIAKIETYYSTNLRNNNCKITFELPHYEDIFLQMMFKIGLNGDTSNLIPIDHFGDGFISMFVMAVIQAIAESNTDDKCLFLFEEPESFLHENHQEYFYKMVLCNLSERGHQVIYTTHSDRMVDVFDTKGIIRLEFDETLKHTIKKYNETGEFNPNIESVDDVNEVISKENYNSFIKSVEPNLNRILFSRKVILVEGPNDLIVYKTAIEKEVEKLKGDKKFAETYLSFLNIAIIVHHGKATAWLLIELCKHFKLDYFAINDWDFDNDFVDTLSKFKTEKELKNSSLYLTEETGKDITTGKDIKTTKDITTKKGMLTTNWKLINSANIEKIHFNIPKLEDLLGYTSNDKNSMKIFNKVNSLTTFDDKLFPQELRDFLEFSKIAISKSAIASSAVLVSPAD